MNSTDKDRCSAQDLRSAIRGGARLTPKIAGWTTLTARIVDWARQTICGRFEGLGKARGERRLKLVETLQLGGKRQVMLIQCDGQLVLVGAGADSIQSILEMGHHPYSPAPSIGGLPGYDAAGAGPGTGQEAACQ